MIPANKNISKIKTYVPGKSGSIKLKTEPTKLSSNESPIKFSKNTINKINKTHKSFGPRMWGLDPRYSEEKL